MQEKQRNAFTAFFSPPTSTPLIRNPPTTSPQKPPPTTKRTAPKITPRQRTTRPPKKVWKAPLIIICFRAKLAPPLKMYGGGGQLVERSSSSPPPLPFFSPHLAFHQLFYTWECCKGTLCINRLSRNWGMGYCRGGGWGYNLCQDLLITCPQKVIIYCQKVTIEHHSDHLPPKV